MFRNYLAAALRPLARNRLCPAISVFERRQLHGAAGCAAMPYDVRPPSSSSAPRRFKPTLLLAEPVSGAHPALSIAA
jgi:hypothetical protein